MAVDVLDKQPQVDKAVRDPQSKDTTYTLITSFASGLGDSSLSYSAFTFDAVPELSVNLGANVTSYPVESGSFVTDHVQINNEKYTLTGFITNTPLKKRQDMLNSVALENRVSKSLEFLEGLYNSRQPFMFVTEHRIIDSVVIEHLSYDYKAEDALVFNLELQKIRFVDKKSIRVSITAKKTATNKSGGGTKKIPLPASTFPERSAAQADASKRGLK